MKSSHIRTHNKQNNKRKKCQTLAISAVFSVRLDHSATCDSIGICSFIESHMHNIFADFREKCSCFLPTYSCSKRFFSLFFGLSVPIFRCLHSRTHTHKHKHVFRWVRHSKINSSIVFDASACIFMPISWNYFNVINEIISQHWSISI